MHVGLLESMASPALQVPPVPAGQQESMELLASPALRGQEERRVSLVLLALKARRESRE